MRIVTCNAAWVLRPAFSIKSSYPVAMQLKQLLKASPKATVVTYNTYYQDAPYYLRRTLTVVNWQDEIAWGIAHQPSAKQWLTT